MLGWVGIDQPMKMRETSRAVDKKLQVNNIPKKKVEILEPALEELNNRMIANGIPVDIAQKACGDIRPFAGYGFNLSHAACYAFIAFQTGYLKANYPLEYMTALLQVFYTEEDKVIKFVKVSRDMGIEVLPPDINRSEIGFTIDGENAIRFGLGSIKGLGDATLEAILEERKIRKVEVIKKEDMTHVPTELELKIAKQQISEDSNSNFRIEEAEIGGIYTTVEDLINRVPKKNLNKKSLAALCYSGAFDTFTYGTTNTRFDFMAHILSIRGESPDEELAAAISKYSDRLKFEKEREVLGMYVSGHVLSRLAEPTNWEELDDAMHFTTVSLTEAKVIITKRGDEMAFLRCDTLEGEKDLTVFPQVFAKNKEGLVPGMLLKVGVKGSMNWQRNKKDYIVNSLTIPKKINKEIWKRIEENKPSDQGAA
ncbi:hypothetical protein ABFV99_13840 [Cytobacillus horneckiae]|uniref:helix-hairpin-helix domain-containing protein n=1 Tax=Cytobacillus horneckiae TaxID=549687 RepID=UPI0034CE7907